MKISNEEMNLLFLKNTKNTVLSVSKARKINVKNSLLFGLDIVHSFRLIFQCICARTFRIFPLTPNQRSSWNLLNYTFIFLRSTACLQVYITFFKQIIKFCSVVRTIKWIHHNQHIRFCWLMVTCQQVKRFTPPMSV